MAIADTIRSEMTTAWKAGDTQRRDALRLVIAALENARIDLGHALLQDFHGFLGVGHDIAPAHVGSLEEGAKLLGLLLHRLFAGHDRHQGRSWHG